MGPWLQLIIQNTLYVFAENPGYTLAEIPQFLTIPGFRNHLLENVTHNTEIVDFWRQFEEDKRRGWEQAKQIDAALTRINTPLGHQYVKDILGQPVSTIDFSDILEKQKLIFLRLSSNLPPDIKRFVGTIILSELLHAVRNRTERKRKQ